MRRWSASCRSTSRKRLGTGEDPPLHCYGVTRARLLKLMGHNYGRDNVRKRAVRRKKAERIAKKNKKKAAK